MSTESWRIHNNKMEVAANVGDHGLDLKLENLAQMKRDNPPLGGPCFLPNPDYSDDMPLEDRVRRSVWVQHCQAGCGHRFARVFRARYCDDCLRLQNRIASAVAREHGDRGVRVDHGPPTSWKVTP